MARETQILESSLDAETCSGSFTVTSFFSGCGGLDLGFIGDFEYRDHRYLRQPFHIIRAYEIDKKSVDTYKRNLGEHIEIADLSKVDVSKMQASDILIGGFPCQEFSFCGPQGGVNSPRGGLFRSMSRYAKHWRPKIVIAENVAGLVSLNKGAELSIIKRSFSNAGYRMLMWKVFAPDYGVPQARQRIFLIFVRNDLKSDPLPPAPTFRESHRSVRWAIEDLEKVCDESISNQSQFFKAAVAGKGHGQGDEVSPADAPGYTVRANTRSRVQFHYDLQRRLTVRECARLQTFPDNFIFPHEATPNMRQIGNAVPPVLAYSVATSVATYLQSI